MALYNEKVGETNYPNLDANIRIKKFSGSGIVAANTGALKQGTVMAMDAGKLVVMDNGKTPYGILTDDVTVGNADEVVEVFLTGNFNKAALIVADGYTLSETDIQTLRNGGIFVENVVG